MKDYMVECTGNCSYPIYKRRKFLFFGYWSWMYTEVTLDSAMRLVDNLRLINNSLDKPHKAEWEPSEDGP